ncbi:glycosyltransferase [Capnocytophaga sp.]|uniref:glycosyltransferase n=1 Tax=Capnocytophaga sp. TaxID=44737 RepID=UPI0026DC07EE|nr:glycosyltransferase [Capnocytophaga sp.]MDO5104876.1 glycosyltransferase [Capnocytophaga sp.]
MKLSIIIPVYNAEKYLDGCLSSLFEQQLSPADFEIILVNDGSTDNSLLICSKLAEKHTNIKVFSQENQGQSVARNVGLKYARGKYIYFIDSDDYLKSGYLNTLLEIIENENLDFLGFRFYHTSQLYTPSTQTENLQIEIEGNGLQIISEHSYYNGSCWFIFERSIAPNLFFEDGRLCEDVIFTTQLLLKVKKGRVYSNQIYAYFTNNESTVRTKNPKRLRKINDDMFYVADRFNSIIDSVNRNDYPKAFNRLRARQESYAYFAIIRAIRGKRNFNEVNKQLSVLKNGKYASYPIRNFTTNRFIDRLIKKVINHKPLLYITIQLNHLFSFSR